MYFRKNSSNWLHGNLLSSTKPFRYLIITAIILPLLVSGCIFVGLNNDVKQLNAAVTIIGKVEWIKNSTSPIVVTLSRSENGSYPLQAYTVVYGKDNFLLSVPEGQYYLLAFEDINQDFTLQQNEPVGWHGEPSLIMATPGQIYSDMVIQLRNPSQAKKELPTLFIPGKTYKRVNLKDTTLGKVVDKSIFKQELGPLGMWEPVKFYHQGHSGIYFLEPYNENKIPVLFVHGISGSGYDWLYLIKQLDRERFQPWIVQYPSGIRLGLMSQFLNQSVNKLKATYNFNNLVVVAHSMGGLVSRGFINHQSSADNKDTTLSTFVSISTPWLGHSAASRGIKLAPTAVPAWFDMAFGSPYLNSLHKQPLPNHLRYYLLFSHKGKGRGIFAHSNSDGTVTLRSQLSLKAQEEAIKVTGYDENHISILSSKDVAKKLNEILTIAESQSALQRSSVTSLNGQQLQNSL